MASTLGDWYAKPFRISRRQCLIFMNEGTLFSFIAHGISLKPSEVTKAFLTRLNYVFVEEGLPPAMTLEICREYEFVKLAATASRSLLGSLNELACRYQIYVDGQGGLDHCDMSAVTADVNRTPQKPIGWEYPIAAVTDLLAHS